MNLPLHKLADAEVASHEVNDLIKVGPISGFQEFLPEEQAIFDEVVATIARHYTRAGAVSIATPLVERNEVLTAKGGAINKEIYGLRRLSESDDGSARDLGLKFDLTVPLARYVAQHQSDLTFPLRRQQIDRVYRGERPKSGRYREFIQADLDIVGRNDLSLTADAEPPAIINGQLPSARSARRRGIPAIRSIEITLR